MGQLALACNRVAEVAVEAPVLERSVAQRCAPEVQCRNECAFRTAHKFKLLYIHILYSCPTSCSLYVYIQQSTECVACGVVDGDEEVEELAAHFALLPVQCGQFSAELVALASRSRVRNAVQQVLDIRELPAMHRTNAEPRVTLHLYFDVLN